MSLLMDKIAAKGLFEFVRNWHRVKRPHNQAPCPVRKALEYEFYLYSPWTSFSLMFLGCAAPTTTNQAEADAA